MPEEISPAFFISVKISLDKRLAMGYYIWELAQANWVEYILEEYR